MAAAEPLLVGLGVVLFCLASILSVARLTGHTGSGERPVFALLGGAVLSLAVVLVLHGIEAARLPAFGRFEALSLYSLFVVVVYVYSALRHRLRGVSGILVPYTTIVLLAGISASRKQVTLPAESDTFWLGLHVCTAFFAYALCTLAGMLAIAYVLQDNNLKNKHFGAAFHRLPPLETLDHLMSREIGAAFLMLTISLVFGAHLVRLSGGGNEWLKDPKIIATVATWGVYAVLMHMRTRSDRHGRGMAFITIIGLVFVLFSFIGVHIISDSVHGFALFGAGSYP